MSMQVAEHSKIMILR